MKLENIKKLVKYTHHIYIVNTENGQWISNGYAAAPIIGLPHITLDNVFRMLSLDDEEEKYRIALKLFFPVSTDDFCDDDIKASLLDVKILFKNANYCLLDTDIGTIVLDHDFIKPFQPDINTRFALRDKVIAIFNGLLLVGLVAPFAPNKIFIDSLKTIPNRISMARDTLFVDQIYEQTELD